MAPPRLARPLAALMVRWEPLAAGSGIQHVEAVFLSEARPPLSDCFLRSSSVAC